MFLFFAERISALLNVDSLISVQLDRAQYVFLLRVMENLKETASFLDHQEKRFSDSESTQAMVVGAVIPQLDVSILFPPQAASALQVYNHHRSSSSVAILHHSPS